jgi:hypothetical protein
VEVTVEEEAVVAVDSSKFCSILCGVKMVIVSYLR